MLKGYDALMNLVLDDVEELLRGELAPIATDALPSGPALTLIPRQLQMTKETK